MSTRVCRLSTYENTAQQHGKASRDDEVKLILVCKQPETSDINDTMDGAYELVKYTMEIKISIFSQFFMLP